MKKRILLIGMALLFVGCGKGTNNTISSENGAITSDISETEADAVTEMVDGFEKADYEKFNSLASENGLGWTKIYVDGTISSLFNDSNGIMGLTFQQDDGKEWIISVGVEPIISRQRLEAIVGSKGRIYGIYPGLSLEYKKPMILLDNQSGKLVNQVDFRFEDSSGNVYRLVDFAPDKDEIISWCDNNDTEILLSHAGDDSNLRSFHKSTGLVSAVYDNIDKIYLYQFADPDYEKYSLNTDNPLFDDKFDLQSINENEGVTAYYFVTEDGEQLLVDIIPNEEVTFTMDDVIQAYKDSCVPYTYEEIARNPEKVKDNLAVVEGQVIQVVEDGNTVRLRLNITPIGYGFYEDTIFVNYYREDENEDRILEDDIIKVYGRLNGLTSYTALFGQDVTLPEIIAKYVDIQ